MKTITYMSILCLSLISVIRAQELEGGIFHNGSTLQIKMKVTGSNFNSQISNAKFSIKYQTIYGVTFGSPVNPIPSMSFGLDNTVTVGSYTYKFYAWTGAYTPNWSQNSENLVMEVTISGGDGAGDFELVSGEGTLPGGYLPDWYVESNGLTGTYTTEVYQSTTTSVPLPVELTSFTATINRGTVNLEWKTKTEVNNYGFEVERQIGSGELGVGSWEKIGFVNGSGNSNSPKEYTLTDKNPIGGSKFVYRLKQIDNDGKYTYSKEVEVEIIPDEYELYQNYPNPFNPVTNIKFALPKTARVNLSVYNLLGEKVVTILNEVKEAGYYNVKFNGSGYSSGVYIFRFSTEDFVQIKKMNLIK
jgi:hypothetical protein